MPTAGADQATKWLPRRRPLEWSGSGGAVNGDQGPSEETSRDGTPCPLVSEFLLDLSLSEPFHPRPSDYFCWVPWGERGLWIL